MPRSRYQTEAKLAVLTISYISSGAFAPSFPSRLGSSVWSLEVGSMTPSNFPALSSSAMVTTWVLDPHFPDAMLIR